MLQQTRVEAVVTYYLRFLETLPAIRDLAEADDEKLLKLWEGLGYYTRARNLKKAAQKIMAEHGGVFPDTHQEILALPGIGPYTAGAIASIAFELPRPAVDGNVLRVIARLKALKENVDVPTVRKNIERALAGVYPAEGRGDFTQALMELGAVVCLPNGLPKCEICPLAPLCAARKENTVSQYPVRSVKKSRRAEQRTVLLMVHKGRTAICKRGGAGLLSSLWEFPNAEGKLSKAEVLALADDFGAGPHKIERCGEKKHVFTHIEWRMTVWRVECDCMPPGFQWATQEELASKYALPTAFKICLSR